MFRKTLFIILLLFFSQCSLDTKSGLWTKPKIVEKNKDSFNEIFKPQEILEKEFNPNLKIKINSSYTQNSFVNTLTNNMGYINFESNFKEISKFKFQKIKNFDFITPDLLIGKDNSLVFFDEKGSIFKFDQKSELIWKKNFYNKKEKKQQPVIYFGTDNNILVAADSIANIYAINYSNGDLLWKNFTSSSFNSEIKIFEDKIFVIDFENVIKCISIKDGKELWRFGTERSLIKSQRKLSLIIQS